MNSLTLKKDFQSQIFFTFEAGKIIFSLFIFLIFFFFVKDPKYNYIYKATALISLSGIFGLLVYRFVDRELKYIRYITLILNYSFLIAAIIISKTPYSTLFYWMISGIAITTYMTNIYFSGFLCAIIIGFISQWPYRFIDKNLIDYERFLDGNFQSAFNISLCLLTLLLLFIGYFSELSRNNIYKQLVDAKNKADLEGSFPEHNPNPVMEYFTEDGLVSRNKFATNFMQLASEKDIDVLKSLARNVMYNKEGQTLQLYLTNKHYLINLIPTEFKVNMYFSDITSLINTQEQLKNKESENLAIIDAIPGFVSWIDKDLKYEGVNSQFSDFFGKSKEDFVGEKLGTVETTESVELRGIVLDLFNDSSKESTSKEIYYNYQDRDYWNLIRINKFQNGNKAVLVSVDTTELKMAQMNLIAEQKRGEVTQRLAAFGEMSAGIAHEINNPLAVIKVSAARLKKLKEKDKLTPVSIDEMIKTTFYGVDRIQRIILGMKNLTRDGNKDDFEDALVDEIISDATVLLPQKCQDLGVELDIISVENLKVSCQRVQISQVLVIIINNSIDAIKDLSEKWIRLEILEEKDDVVFKITDSGAGIEEDVKEKLFNPFFTTKAVGQGTGLGLSLAEKIIESHGSTIEVDDTSSNTCFKFSLFKS